MICSEDNNNMNCCTHLADQKLELLPFVRVIAIGYYDGPTEGFTDCATCGQTYAFRKLDWDKSQDVRIIGFAPIAVSFDEIATKLSCNQTVGNTVCIVQPLTEAKEEFVTKLFGNPVRYVVVVEDWPWRSSARKELSSVDTSQISDWFLFLEVPRSTRW